jgi:uncharacterized repeat protein (TIGR01451 family)
MKEKFFRRFLSTVSGFSLLFNSLFAPLTVLAQEVSPTPEPTPTTIEETVNPSPEPTAEATISPTSEPTTEATISATVEPTQVPEESVLSTESPTQEPTQQTQEEQVQTNEPTSLSPSSTSSPTPEVKTVTAENTELNVSLLNDTKSTSLNEFDFSIQQDGSATLITDKADYAPTDTALITGKGFLPNKEYTIEITSTTGNFKFSDKVTSDESGGLFYPYQLDGTYRPDYKVEVKNGDVVISSVTFTDSYTNGNFLCENDLQGANDEPGQKDLTKMCRDTTSPDPVNITWDWDEKSPGGNLGGNTGDACSLFDTDGDGFANYSMCVIVDGNPSVYQNKVLYSCGDAKADRCTNPTEVPSGSVTSNCSANVQSTDPFTNGTDKPDDTVANCSINLSDVGGASSAVLLDVCSYPSQQPNSDPSDCIIASTANDKGTIEVIKDLYPSNDSGRFNLQIDNENIIQNVGDGGTTGSIEFSVGTHTVGEIAYIGTDLANYTSSISCANSQGSISSSGPLTIDLSKNENIVCTITNTRNQGTLRVVKTVVNDNGGTKTASNFSFQVNGGSSTAFETDGTNDLTVAPGNYSVTEPGVAGYATTYDNCANVTVVTDQITTCTITNDDIQPKLTVTKVVVNDNGGDKEISDFPLFVDSTGVTSGIQNGFNVGTYTISETDQEGYTETISGNCASNGSITLGLGDVKSCTITNDDIAPSITLIKNVIKDNGGVAGVNDFGLTIGGVAANSGQKYSVDANKEYAIDEAGLIGYSFTSITGTNCPTNLGETVTLNPGQDITCTITNDDIPGKIIVNKVTNPSEDPQKFDFTLSKSTNLVDSFQLNDLDTPYDSGLLSAGNYSLVEDELTGWDLTSATCDDGSSINNISLSLGETVTCTFNNFKYPKLTIVKDLTPSNDPGKFNLLIGSTIYASNVSDGGTTGSLILNADSYQISETAGTDTNLSDYNTTYSSNCANGEVNLSAGDDITCTIYNTRKTGNIFFDKIVSGSTANDSDWTFTIFENITNLVQGDLHDGDIALLNTGSYTVEETSSVLGYTLTSTGGVCPTFVGSTASLDVTESGGTCTFTNTRDTGSVTVNKEVDSDGDNTFEGGNSQANTLGFSFKVDTSQAYSMGSTVSDIETTITGVTHTVSENDDVPDYHFVGWFTTGSTRYSCNNPEGITLPVTVTVNKDTETNITLCNAIDTATLTLEKVVNNNNGGTKEPSDWEISAIYDSNSLKVQGDGPSVTGKILANKEYSLSELGPTGYSASSWSCTGGSLVDDNLTLSANSNVTCTITNSDQSATLIVKKVVINNNGGTKVANNFTFEVNGGTTTSFETDGQNDLTVNAGTYSVVEPKVDGYSINYDNCDNVVIPNGGTATCTITNDDDQPQYQLIKRVINDDGGTSQISDFDLYINSTQVTSGDINSFDAGNYLITESGPSGYTSSFSGDCDLQGNFSLVVGDPVRTCTLTNDDIAPTLTLGKEVVNDNGGNEDDGDWVLYADGSDRSFYNWGPVVGPNQIMAGVEYTLTESDNNPGYLASSWVCTGGGTQVGNKITLTLDEDVICTITNDDIAPTITLIKDVSNDNGGDANPDDFNLTVGGVSVLSGSTTTVDANTSISLNETVLEGYDFVDITGDSKCPSVLGGSLTLDEGENITCTIHNDDQIPHLTVVKNVVGGNKTSNDFTMYVTANNVSDSSFVGSSIGTTVSLDAGSYIVSEDEIPGYTSSFSDDCSGSIALGESKTCTVTNTRDLGKIEVKKIIDEDGDITSTSDQTPGVNWIIDIDGNSTDTEDPSPLTTDSNGENITADIKTGEYLAIESKQDGYDLVTAYCKLGETFKGTYDNLDGVDGIILGKGETIICTFINTPNGSIHGYKWEDKDGNGNEDFGDNTLGDWVINLYGWDSGTSDYTKLVKTTTTDTTIGSDFGWYWFNHLFPATYKVCEELKIGWTQTYPTDPNCHFVNVPQNNDNAVLNYVYAPTNNFGNFKLAEIGDFVWTDYNGDGIQDTGEPGISGVQTDLYLDNGDGIQDLGGADVLVGSTTTDGSGIYLFTDLYPSNYWVNVVDSTVPTGYAPTTTDPYGPIAVVSGANFDAADFGFVPSKEIKIEKSNDKSSGAKIGDEVTYTLKVKNTGNVTINNLEVIDILPGGFEYVSGSSLVNDVSTSDPTITSGVLKWSIGDIISGQEIKITYKAEVLLGVFQGSSYKNFATCKGTIGSEERENSDNIQQSLETIECNVANSIVTIGTGIGYGGNLLGQVLGASIELPDTGSDTLWIIMALTMLGMGIYINRKYAKK